MHLVTAHVDGDIAPGLRDGVLPDGEYSARSWHTPTARRGRCSLPIGPRAPLRCPVAGVATPTTGRTVKHEPWEYLFIPFNSFNFHDLFHPIWISALLLLVALVVLYNVRTRQLRAHAPYLEMYEWLLWTGVISFGLIVTYALFVFDFLFVVITIPIMLGVFIWIRFIRFPPILRAYEAKLARQRYFSRTKFAHPESTIRKTTARRRRRR